MLPALPAALASSQSLGTLVRVGSRVPWASLGRWLARAAAVAVPSGLLFVRKLLERIYASVELQPPTAGQLRDEDEEANPLCRALPVLKGKAAWRQLGDFPTPVQRFSSGAGDFWVKREDLASGKYGGNKVRTLQYQLAAFESQLARTGGAGRLLAIGTGGSNQIVATKVHAAMLKLPPSAVEGCTMNDDEPEMDNTLNFLSALSLPGQDCGFGKLGSRVLAALWPWQKGPKPWVLMPGGNGPLGVLGQVGGALELAEQIARGELPDPDGIVVAMGSTCTTTGLLLGVVLARHLGMPAFKKPNFRIHAQPVHPGMQMLQRFFGFLTSKNWPLTVGRGLRETAAIIARMGGPDLTEAALAALRETLVVSLDGQITGKYGAHSTASAAAKRAYDAEVQPPKGAPHLWLCGHFTAKSFALLRKLQEEARKDGREECLLFWQTKSAVQPRGSKDEWAAWQEQSRKHSTLSKWSVVGGITGHPDVVGESAGESKAATVKSPGEYRAFMTPIDPGA